MRQILANTQLNSGNASIENRAVERKLLALDALSKLTWQFSHQPEFQVLVRVLLLTLSGQFVVPSTFAILSKPNSRGKFYYFGTGSLHDNVELSTLEFSSDVSFLSEKYGSAFRTDTPGVQEHLKSIMPYLENARIKVVCPLSHGNRFFGIVGLGEKVSTHELSDEDLLLLSTMVQTITPFLANSYLYWEITDLNAWYAELINSVKQGLFVFDSTLKLKKINQAAIDALQWFDRSGCSSGLLHNRHILEIFPDHLCSTWAERMIAGSRGQNSGLIQNLVARYDGLETYYNVRVSRTTALDDTDSDLVIVLDDVTQQRQSEQHLFELQKFADKGIMASSIAHELNNFLALVAGGLEMTRLASSRNDEQRTKANLEKLRVNVASMERFTAGLTVC